MKYVYYLLACTIIYLVALFILYKEKEELTLADMVVGFIFSYLPIFNIITVSAILIGFWKRFIDETDTIVIFKRKDKQ